MNDERLILAFRISPLLFVEKMFKLTPQKLKEGIRDDLPAEEYTADMFEEFVKGKEISWQQWLILRAVGLAMQNKAPRWISVSSGHGVGKMHSYEMRLPTPQGERRWGDLKVGDYVFGLDGKPTMIVRTQHYSNVPMYRVKFDDGSYAEVSSGHLWTVRGRQERRNNLTGWRTMETEDLVRIGIKRSNGVSQSRQWEIPQHGNVEFDEQKVNIHPYMMGVWLGDGTKGEPSYTKTYKELDEKIRSLGFNVHDGDNGKSHRVQGVAHLFRGGVFDKGSFERYIPDEYKFNTYNNRKALFEGLCDTDGEVNKSGSIGYSTTSKRLCEDMMWLARSLGCKAMLQPTIKRGWYNGNDGKKVICRDCYRITINCPFNPFTLIHRKDTFKPSEHRYITRWIDSIERIKNTDGMCITVQNEDGLYLANDFIVTHNSTVLAWLNLWFLFCFKNSKIGCTAPSSDQLFDVLWSEISIWLRKMPEEIAALYNWQTDYLRIVENEPSWYSRARTGRKEKPEALAGLHADDLAIFADETSGIEEVIFKTAHGSLTNENTLVLFISNPTRNIGYFYDSHHKEKEHYQTMKFSSLDSPLVDSKYVDMIERKYGKGSNEWRIRVLGEFPSEDAIDDKGYVQLISDFSTIQHADFVGRKLLGVDPSGMGINKTVYVLRDRFKAEIIGYKKKTTPQKIAEDVATIIEQYNLDPMDVTMDIFGVGAESYQILATMGYDVNGINVDEDAEDKETFLNKRAEASWRVKQWLHRGGELIDHEGWDELKTIRYKRNMKGKIQIMPKVEMQKAGFKSPDCFDAIMLTMCQDHDEAKDEYGEEDGGDIDGGALG